jgi:hypothetical protein
MTITSEQRVTIMVLWGQVCKDRGWKQGDKALRLSTFSQILGRPLGSTNDVERLAECTKLMNELRTRLGVSLKAAQETVDPTLNEARILRNQILTELVPCLEVYVLDVRAFMTGIMEDKNRWWKIDRPSRDIQLTDLDARPVVRQIGKELKESPSQLKQLQMTLSARLHAKRREAGDTIHQMRIKAQVPCHCAQCEPSRPQMAKLPAIETPKVEEEFKPF